MRLASAIMRLLVNRVDTFAVQLAEGGYMRVQSPLTIEVLERHLSGELTVGAYLLDPQSNTKTLVFDVDPEWVHNPQDVALSIYGEACRRLHPDGVILEASRWPDPSYHIWVCFDPIPASAARWIGGRILEFSGSPGRVEVFPKQDRIGPDGVGSLVKLPLGLHRVAGKWSVILDQNLNPLPSAHILTIRPLRIPEDELRRISSSGGRPGPEEPIRAGRIRPCIREALKRSLTGAKGHLMRVAVASEYISRGVRDEERLVKLFRSQENFSEEKTRRYIQDLLKRDYHFSCTKIEELGFCLGDLCPLTSKFITPTVQIAGSRLEIPLTAIKVEARAIKLG
ncbi:MAG: hypothetical protein QXD04_04350 [Candidatus Bathyarchaeia archaeon]